MNLFKIFSFALVLILIFSSFSVLVSAEEADSYSLLDEIIIVIIT